jgi:hypothetical protein
VDLGPGEAGKSERFAELWDSPCCLHAWIADDKCYGRFVLRDELIKAGPFVEDNPELAVRDIGEAMDPGGDIAPAEDFACFLIECANASEVEGSVG